MALPWWHHHKHCLVYYYYYYYSPNFFVLFVSRSSKAALLLSTRHYNWQTDGRTDGHLHVTEALKYIAAANCYSLNARRSSSALFWTVLGPFRPFVSPHSERLPDVFTSQTGRSRPIFLRRLSRHWTDLLFHSRRLKYCFRRFVSWRCKLPHLLSTSFDFGLVIGENGVINAQFSLCQCVYKRSKRPERIAFTLDNIHYSSECPVLSSSSSSFYFLHKFRTGRQ